MTDETQEKQRKTNAERRYEKLVRLTNLEPSKINMARIDTLFEKISPQEYLEMWQCAMREQPNLLSNHRSFGGGGMKYHAHHYQKRTTILSAYAGKVLETPEQRAQEEYFRRAKTDFEDEILRIGLTEDHIQRTGEQRKWQNKQEKQKRDINIL